LSRSVTVEPWTPFSDIVGRLAEHRISAAPVLDPEGNVPPTWSRRRRLEREKAAAVVAGELMTTPAVTVAPTATVTEAARRMHIAGVKRLPLVDDAGRLAGIVSRADLLKVYIRSDEAIWREIMDDVIVRDFIVEDRLPSDVDDRDADLAMTYPYPFMRIRT